MTTIAKQNAIEVGAENSMGGRPQDTLPEYFSGSNKPKALRWILAVAPALITVTLGILLLAAIYFTLLDWEWVTFLGGVLFAALLALASRASRAEWAITSQNQTLAKTLDSLSQATTARQIANSEAKICRDQMRLLAEGMSAMVAYVDLTERVRFHNRRFREWLGLRDIQVEGQLIRDVVGLGNYSEIQDKVLKALSGEQVNFEHTLTSGNGITRHLHITYLPHMGEGSTVAGFVALLEDPPTQGLPRTAESPKKSAATDPQTVSPVVVTNTNGQTMYLHSMTEQLTGWKNPEARLRQALERDEFRLYCQEMTAIADNAAPRYGYEILIRLQEEEDNLTPPGAFIPVAEAFNMTTELDFWVVRNIVAWHRQNRADTAYWQGSMYFINLFSSSLRDIQFSDYVRKKLADKEVPPHILCFEVNEDEAVSDPAIVARFANDMRRIGCRTALAAFGGRKVSFDILKHLPLDFLKIDGDIVRNIDTDDVKLAKVKAISRVSKVIGLKTIAPFVENNAVRDMLRECGIDYVQGFGLSKPHPIADLRT